MLIKPRRLALSISFAAIGAIYFVAFTGLEVHPALKQQLVLLPVQLGILIYLLWGRKPRKAPDKVLDKAPNP